MLAPIPRVLALLLPLVAAGPTAQLFLSQDIVLKISDVFDYVDLLRWLDRLIGKK
jgi:hypothetical protein